MLILTLVGKTFLQFLADRCSGVDNGLPGGYIVRLGKNGHTLHFVHNLAGEWIKLGDGLNFLIEQFDANRTYFLVTREYVDDFTADTVSTPP